jgi:hypothetical protein
MIRILYMSDLHIEMERRRLSIPGWTEFLRRRRELPGHPPHGPLLSEVGPVDLVVMAGDIHKGLRGIIYAEEVAAYLDAPVLIIAGNHEYYYHDMATLLPGMRKADAHSGKRVRFLENGVARFEFAGRRLNVLAATLWTDFALHGDVEAAMFDALRRMNDYRCIYTGGQVFLPQDARRLHESSRAWLHAEFAALRGEACVVVTHHAPSARFLGERQGAIAPAYASELLGEFAGYAPLLWIHGHTHFRHDSVAEGIHVVSAPRGYVGYDGLAALRYRPGIVEI